MADVTPTAVVEFIATLTATPPERLQSTTRLREDLGLDGDDVDDFLRGLTERFDVDMAGFDFYRYFREEPHLAWVFTQLKEARRRGEWRTHPITIADVEYAVRRKAWHDPARAPAI